MSRKCRGYQSIFLNIEDNERDAIKKIHVYLIEDEIKKQNGDDF